MSLWLDLVTVKPLDWTEWRQCPVCKVDTGRACRTQSSRIVDGATDGTPFELSLPHSSRLPRRRGGQPMTLIRADRYAAGAAAVEGTLPPAAPATSP